MAKRQRYYSDYDADPGITRSQLRRLGRKKQLEYMRAWFIHYYEDPVENTPYESAEGGYLYIWGGPYDTLEQLESEFGGAIAFDRIQEAAHELEADGTTDWAPSSFHPDRERVEEEDIDAEAGP